MSSIVGAGAGTAYTTWQQTIAGTAALGFSTANIKPTSTDATTFAQRVTVTCESAGLRVRWTGFGPTATGGHIFTVGDVLILEGHANIANAQFISNASGVAGTIQCTAER